VTRPKLSLSKAYGESDLAVCLFEQAAARVDVPEESAESFEIIPEPTMKTKMIYLLFGRRNLKQKPRHSLTLHFLLFEDADDNLFDEFQLQLRSRSQTEFKKKLQPTTSKVTILSMISCGN